MQVDFTQAGLLLVSALCGALVAWMASARRGRTLVRMACTRAEARANERVAVVRDLHDTLLQGVQGLLLTFHVVSQKMTAGDEPRALMERALSTAERIVTDARGRAAHLLPEHLIDAELAAALCDAGSELNRDDAVHFSVRRQGTRTTLKPQVVDELFFIACEALTNAFRHAGATQIELELGYGARFFSVVCKDDGRGFVAGECLRQGQRGLEEIERRSRELGGESMVHSVPGHGARVIVVVPAYLAYPGHSRLMFYLRAWRLAERNPLSRPRAALPKVPGTEGSSTSGSARSENHREPTVMAGGEPSPGLVVGSRPR